MLISQIPAQITHLNQKNDSILRRGTVPTEVKEAKVVERLKEVIIEAKEIIVVNAQIVMMTTMIHVEEAVTLGQGPDPDRKSGDIGNVTDVKMRFFIDFNIDISFHFEGDHAQRIADQRNGTIAERRMAAEITTEETNAIMKEDIVKSD